MKIDFENDDFCKLKKIPGFSNIRSDAELYSTVVFFRKTCSTKTSSSFNLIHGSHFKSGLQMVSSCSKLHFLILPLTSTKFWYRKSCSILLCSS